MTDMQKKEARIGKRSRGMAAAACLLLAVLTAACGQVEEPVPVQLSSGDMEEPYEEDGGADAEEAADADNGQQAADSGNQPGEAADEENASASEGKADENAGDNSEDNAAEKVSAQSAGSAELEGNVHSVSQDSFVVSRTEVWSEGGADFAAAPAPGYEEKEELITVHVSQNCSWQYKTVKNGGVNPEDISSREGLADELKEGMAIHMEGSWQEDGSFLAESIVMMTFM